MLLRDGAPVSLEPKVFETLLVLVRHGGRLVGKEELMLAVWPDTIVEESNLTRNISVLRKALQRDDGGTSYIETAPKRGYRFVGQLCMPPAEPVELPVELIVQSAKVSVVVEEEESDEPAATQPIAPALPSPAVDRRKRRTLAVALALLLVALATAVYFGFFRRPPIDSLAVLPFVNVGANPDAKYLSDGITDGIINSLAQLPALKVMSRNSVFQYKGKETDARQAGQALGVRAVLTGKVAHRGDDLLISVELVDVRDNSHLWGEQYSYKLSNLPVVQTDLARDVAQQLRLQLSSAEQQQLAQRGTENAEAYDLYLKGRHLMNSLADNQQISFGYFQRAVEKDPRFALAWAGLAEAYMAKASVGVTLRLASKEAYPLAKAAAEKAVALDDTLPEAHVSLAQIAFQYEWDWPRAEREFQRAIALKPDYVPAHHEYAHYLVALGRFVEALVETQRALAPDPLSLEINWHLGWHYWQTRQYDLAVPQLQKVLAIKPNFTNAHIALGMVYVKQGQYQKGIAELQKAGNMGDLDNRGFLGYAYAVAGQRDEARKQLTQLQEEAKTEVVSPNGIAGIYAGLDEKDQAFAWLEKAIAERDGNLTRPGLKADPQFDNLRSDARFAGLLRRMGLPQ